LPGTPNRTVLAARIDGPDGELPVLCTHLSADPAGSAERRDQVRTVVDLAVSTGRGDFPQVIAGDLNAEPDSDEVRLLSGTKTAPHRSGFILLDAWQFAEDDDPGWTWRRDNPYIRYSFNARIDYLHIAEPGPDGVGVPLRVWVAGNNDVDGVRPSDHLAVVADLKRL
ncbi:MAG TPA: endonuclease/exonuclease/phosphatase family protein, partial [Mycobacteriales bacterium]|nr:endonuclease/exonuclease/phosphatase family protein [Mycobacteriales bacterium]